MAAQTKPPQDLSPDLKQIYDRVMNASAQGSTTPQPPSTPTTVATPQAESVKPSTPQTPNNSQPTMPSVPPASPTPPTPTAPQEPFLTSAAPRPLQGSVGVKSFSINKDDKEKNNAVKPGGEKKGLSKNLIIVLGIIFFGFWTFFWVVFFFNPFG